MCPTRFGGRERYNRAFASASRTQLCWSVLVYLFYENIYRYGRGKPCGRSIPHAWLRVVSQFLFFQSSDFTLGRPAVISDASSVLQKTRWAVRRERQIVDHEKKLMRSVSWLLLAFIVCDILFSPKKGKGFSGVSFILTKVPSMYAGEK